MKNLKYINHQSIIIEEPRKRKSIVQCQKCQQYGHSKNYCMRPYRCVKCAQGHRTADCPKTDRNTPAKCALCLGAHPSNYKGCEVYKEILSRKSNKQTHLRNRVQTTQAVASNSNQLNTYLDTKTSYAEKVRMNGNNKNVETITPNKIEEMLV